MYLIRKKKCIHGTTWAYCMYYSGGGYMYCFRFPFWWFLYKVLIYVEFHKTYLLKEYMSIALHNITVCTIWVYIYINNGVF
jgi:hypothetical protein